MARADDDEVFSSGRRRTAPQNCRNRIPPCRRTACARTRAAPKASRKAGCFRSPSPRAFGDERTGTFQQRTVLHHQPVIGAGRKVIRPRIAFELGQRTGFGITSAVVPVSASTSGGIALPVLLGRRRVAEIVVKVIVGSRTVGESMLTLTRAESIPCATNQS